ncbi:tetratricopeptide repeat protein [Candidatus Nitrospira bockiana]
MPIPLPVLPWSAIAAGASTPLPDAGPRYERPIQGPGAEPFTEGLLAYREHNLAVAQTRFQAVVAHHPADPLAAPARAFLAEIIALGGSDQHRREAIDRYRAIVRDERNTPDAGRARWRIGDLFAEIGWLMEAKAAYEQALAESPSDAGRALLGIGVVLMKQEAWKEAEQILDRIKTATDDSELLAHAAFSRGDAFYAQRRLPDALAVYDDAMARWPALVRYRPHSLLAMAEAKAQSGDGAAARALYGLFSNLYPTHPQAAMSLIKIADGWRAVGLSGPARVFYGEVFTRYRGTPGETVARMRLAELGRDLVARDPSSTLRLAVQGLFETTAAPVYDAGEQEAIFRAVAKTYDTLEVGSEALFHLGESLEAAGRPLDAVQVYRELSTRGGAVPGDPWPAAARGRLVALLSPWIHAALQAHDDLAAVALFHRHGPSAEALYAGTDLLLWVADAHRRAGFSPQAVKLYQALLAQSVPDVLRERALLGLGHTYVEQDDLPAARRVFERYLLQYPAGRGKAEALKHLAVILERQGDAPGVIRIVGQWERAARSQAHPDRPGLLLRLARAQRRKGDVAAALKAVVEAEKAGGLRTAGQRLEYADLLGQAGRFDRALEQYRRVVDGGGAPEDVDWALLRAAMLHERERRARERRRMLTQLRDTTQDELVRRVGAILLDETPATRAGGEP